MSRTRRRPSHPPGRDPVLCHPSNLVRPRDATDHAGSLLDTVRWRPTSRFRPCHQVRATLSPEPATTVAGLVVEVLAGLAAALLPRRLSDPPPAAPGGCSC